MPATQKVTFGLVFWVVFISTSLSLFGMVTFTMCFSRRLRTCWSPPNTDHPPFGLPREKVFEEASSSWCARISDEIYLYFLMESTATRLWEGAIYVLAWFVSSNAPDSAVLGDSTYVCTVCGMWCNIYLVMPRVRRWFFDKCISAFSFGLFVKRIRSCIFVVNMWSGNILMWAICIKRFILAA